MREAADMCKTFFQHRLINELALHAVYSCCKKCELALLGVVCNILFVIMLSKKIM